MIINPEAVFNVAGIEKSWDDFEKFASENEDKLKSIEKHVAWDIWTASRQALVVELPENQVYQDAGFYYDEMSTNEVKSALKEAGVSYK